MECDLETSVPDWVVTYPQTLPLFQALGIEYGCGGRSLAWACAARGLSPDFVLEQIRHVLGVVDETASSVSAGTLESIQVGLPREYGEESAADPMDRLWTTAFYKERVAGPVQVGFTQIVGDGQADQVHHGGPDKAILAYAASHYPAWRDALDQPGLPFGGFGENFTVSGLTEREVCIGDTWAIGSEVVVQVSQPRQPCWKLARRWRVKTLALQVQQTGRTGWYFRVLSEGTVTAGMPLILVERPFPEWTVDRANQVMHHDKSNIAAAQALAALPELSESWRTTLQRRGSEPDPDTAPRLGGNG